MTTGMELKRQLVDRINEILDGRIAELQKRLEAARESRDNETKSSVGDKYETGRAMVQMEMGKIQDQLNNSLKLKKAILQIDLKSASEHIQFGSLVFTKHRNYFVSVGLGVVDVEMEKYFAISLAAPIGQLLKHKKAGDRFDFQGKAIEILKII